MCMPDGTLDPNFAPTTDGLVRAIAVGTGTVFAGGEFSHRERRRRAGTWLGSPPRRAR